LAEVLTEQLYVQRTMGFTVALEQRLRDLQVDEVTAAIRRYLDPKQWVQVYVGDFAAKP